MTEALSFIHRFERGAATEPPLLLLHGTGGDENDLLPLGEMIAPGATMLSPRGKVLENGMPRFFRRLADGVFDEDDVRRRAVDLADFIVAASARYGVPVPIALGYSNGANTAAAVLLLRPEALAGAILLTLPLSETTPVDLTGCRQATSCRKPTSISPNSGCLHPPLRSEAKEGDQPRTREASGGWWRGRADSSLASLLMHTSPPAPLPPSCWRRTVTLPHSRGGGCTKPRSSRIRSRPACCRCRHAAARSSWRIGRAR